MRVEGPLTSGLLENLTGFKPDAKSGQVIGEGRTLVLSDGDFPLHVEYEGKRYVIIRSKRGGLLMNAA